MGPKSSSEFLLKSLSSPCEAVGTSPAQKLTGRLLRADVGLAASGLLEGNSGTSWTTERKASELRQPPSSANGLTKRHHLLVTSTEHRAPLTHCKEHHSGKLTNAPPSYFLSTSQPGSAKFHFHSLSLLHDFLDGVLCKKSEILCTKKSRSFRLAKKKVILLLVLMDRGLGKTLELSAFSTIVT